MLFTSLPAQVIAQTTSAQPVTVDFAVPSASPAGFDKPVSAEALEGYRGGTEVVHNDMTLTGTTTDNTAINVATGIPVVIQNSGANVLIQNALILNLQMN